MCHNFQDAPHRNAILFKSFQDAPHGSAIFERKIDEESRMLRARHAFSSAFSACSAREDNLEPKIQGNAQDAPHGSAILIELSSMPSSCRRASEKSTGPALRGSEGVEVLTPVSFARFIFIIPNNKQRPNCWFSAETHKLLWHCSHSQKIPGTVRPQILITSHPTP